MLASFASKRHKMFTSCSRASFLQSLYLCEHQLAFVDSGQDVVDHTLHVRQLRQHVSSHHRHRLPVEDHVPRGPHGKRPGPPGCNAVVASVHVPRTRRACMYLYLNTGCARKYCFKWFLFSHSEPIFRLRVWKLKTGNSEPHIIFNQNLISPALN